MVQFNSQSANSIDGKKFYFILFMHSFIQQNLKMLGSSEIMTLTVQCLKGRQGSSFNQDSASCWHFGFALEPRSVASPPSGEAALATPQ